MRLSSFLVDDWISVPMEVTSLAEGLQELAGLLAISRVADERSVRKLARDVAFGSQGDVVRINDDIVLALGRLEALDDISVLLGVAPRPFVVTAEGKDPPATARAVVFLLSPRRLGRLREQLVPTLIRVFRDPDQTRQLLEASSPVEIRGIKELMEAELHDRLLVEDALTPLRYRIYPDTPLHEVVGLMIRRRLRAVPVVGPSYEVLGIVTSGDALRNLLPRKPSDEEGEGVGGPGTLMARDVMSRTVMCVSEDQSLLDAAHMMINRQVEQLPVVREGELIGFLTRETILRALFGDEAPDEARPEEFDEPD